MVAGIRAAAFNQYSARRSITYTRVAYTLTLIFEFYVSVNHTLETILTLLMHEWAVMWRPSRHRLSYPQVWPEDRRHVATIQREIASDVHAPIVVT